MIRRIWLLVAVWGMVVCGWAQTAATAPTTASASAVAAPAAEDDLWWKHAVIYEIYPRSFQDSNGDGMAI